MGEKRRHHTFRSCPLWAKKSPLIWVPKNKPRLCLFARKRGPQSKPRFYLFALGKSGGTSCFNDDKVIGLRNLVTERDIIRATSLPNAPLLNALYSQQTADKVFTIEDLQVIHLLA